MIKLDAPVKSGVTANQLIKRGVSNTALFTRVKDNQLLVLGWWRYDIKDLLKEIKL